MGKTIALVARDPEKEVLEKDLNPISWFNKYDGAQFLLGYFVQKPLGKFTGVNSFSYTSNKEMKKKPGIIYEDGYFKAVNENELDVPIGELYTPFEFCVDFVFAGSWRRAGNFIEFYLMQKDIPYIRVGHKYFKQIYKADHNGIVRTELKVWDKQTIIDDYGKVFLEEVRNYDDFTIVPDNKGHSVIHGNHYNLYSPFEHKPAEEFEESDIYWITTLLKHIFGEQYDLGLKYMKTLYDLPTQKLPILVLTSEARGTGKTTFLDFLEMLFGANAVIINPQDIANSFNGTYATSNIIMIEESRFDSVQATEKLKNLATQKKIMVNTKFVQQYSIPFHGKLVITSNDEKKFSKVDESEIRYWVRKVPVIEGKSNHGILKDLKKEIPYFLAFLNTLPDIDTSKSRMVFEAELLKTEALATVKKESRSSLYKELEILLETHCQEYPQYPWFKFIAKDLKDAWFKNNARIEINYINSVLSKEMKLEREPMQRYTPLETHHSKRSGTPYKYENPFYDPDSTERKRF